MKVCIPTEETKGLDSIAYGHFGSAPYFLIYDTVANNFEILDNGESNHEHGQCNPITPLREKGVDIVIVAGMGQRALLNLQSMGIAVFRTAEGQSISSIISNLDPSNLEMLTIENSCAHHNCH